MNAFILRHLLSRVSLYVLFAASILFFHSCALNLQGTHLEGDAGADAEDQVQDWQDFFDMDDIDDPRDDQDIADGFDPDIPDDVPIEDFVQDDVLTDPEPEDAHEEEPASSCTPGPPVTFADGVTYTRELHVGTGMPYGQVSDAAADAASGDKIIVHSGTYSSQYITDLQGTEAQPIAIVAAGGESPPVFSGPGTCLHFVNPRYVLIEGIIVTNCASNGIVVDDGGDYTTPAGPLVVRHVTIRDNDPAGGGHALRLIGVDNFVIYGCRFETWSQTGRGIDFGGCHDGLVAGNTFTHRPNQEFPDAMRIKGGSSNIEVLGNLFDHAGARGVSMGGNSGGSLRPAGAGYEAADIRVIANIFVGCETAAAFVGCEGGCLFAHNTVYLPERWVFRILNENPGLVPLSRDGIVLFNILVVDSSMQTVINDGANTDAASFTFDGNLWFHLDDSSYSFDPVPTSTGTVVTQTHAIIHEDPLLENPGALNFSLLSGSPAIGTAGDLDVRSVDYEEKCYNDPASLGAIEYD